MGIFKENYGRLGKLNRDEWKKLLNSNKGLFKRVRAAPPTVIGPTLDEDGRVVADLMVIEIESFMKVATTDQREFYEELERVNPKAAKEYMLTIGGSIKRWKEDIKWLRVLQRYLKKGEDILKEEETLVTKGIKLQELFYIHLPPVLKRHFPPLFGDLNVENLNLDELLDRIRSAEKKVSSEEHYLDGYLKKRKREMPFLFE